MLRTLCIALCFFSAPAPAQFQLPAPQQGGAPSPGAPPKAPVADRIVLQYGYGSESELEYRKDRDLDRRLPDESSILKPQLNGIVVYRPTRWLETTLEVIAEKEIALDEERRLVLPGGEVQEAPRRRASLLVDQAFIRVHDATAPLEFALGRKNYEDERHWLYDTSMDIASVALRQGRLRTEFWFGREALADLDLAPNKREPRDRIDTWILYADYRLENARLGAYAISRNDRAHLEGHPRLHGVRIHAFPTERLSYWAEGALGRGKDELARKFDGRAFDAGFNYKFTGTAWYPNVTVAYAEGSGDRNPDDARNGEFRQSGLHSNESRFAGVSKFKVYGEALDPELSNLRILTAGLGLLPAANLSVDLVVHRYEFKVIAEESRNWALTAPANQFNASRDVGKGLDLVIGVRRAFGIRRLGFDLRFGWFFPGGAFRANEGDEDSPVLRRQQRAVAAVIKLWW